MSRRSSRQVISTGPLGEEAAGPPSGCALPAAGVAAAPAGATDGAAGVCGRGSAACCGAEGVVVVGRGVARVRTGASGAGSDGLPRSAAGLGTGVGDWWRPSGLAGCAVPVPLVVPMPLAVPVALALVVPVALAAAAPTAAVPAAVPRSAVVPKSRSAGSEPEPSPADGRPSTGVSSP